VDKSTNFSPLILQKLLHKHRKINVKIITDSMSPLICPGDIITIYPINRSKLKRYDIIVFSEQTHYTCHFIWSKSQLIPNAYITKSLKHPENIDFTVKAEDIIGITHYKISYWQKIKIILFLLFRHH
jgi:signal peptidase I